ncbi:hypothetical protein [Pseudoalteromonas luteoviolacea]|uniref:hypothetical protein n=1 Tax=Pseudoalteromonas luteoviolacea TaxID=43657 RepID=UPI001150EDC7|nr:hypothetical protein [Pseudoalteromonas luteoviolacea]TQF72210.1 hypothetical protein FLM44_14605 [Pseudoalteromonas luteoviolacea]
MKLVLDFLSLLINRGLDSLLVLILVPTFIATFGIKTYGVFSLGLSVVAFFIILVRFGFETHILTSKKEELAQRCRDVFSGKLLLVMVVSPIFVLYAVTFWEAENLPVLFLLYGIVVFEICALSHAFIVLSKSHFLTMIGAFRFVSLALLCTLFIDAIELTTFVVIYVLVFVVCNFLQYCILQKQVGPIIGFNLTQAVGVTEKSKHYFGSKAASLLSDKLFLVACGIFLAPVNFAQIDVTLKVFAFAIMVPTILIGILLSRISNGCADKKRYFYIALSIFTGVVMASFISLFNTYIGNYFGIEIERELLLIAIAVILTTVSLTFGELILIPKGMAKENSIAAQVSIVLLVLMLGSLNLLNVEATSSYLISVFIVTKLSEILVKARYVAY